MPAAADPLRVRKKKEEGVQSPVLPPRSTVHALPEGRCVRHLRSHCPLRTM
jgi:hypothetical protein